GRIIASQIVRVSSVCRQLVGAAYESAFGIYLMGVFGLWNLVLPEIITVVSFHDEVALAPPFCREFTLSPDGDIACLGRENTILSGRVQVLDCFQIILIILSTIQHVKCFAIIAGIVCFPSHRIILISSVAITGI